MPFECLQLFEIGEGTITSQLAHTHNKELERLKKEAEEHDGEGDATKVDGSTDLDKPNQINERSPKDSLMAKGVPLTRDDPKPREYHSLRA